MKILFLTSSDEAEDGYAVVGKNISKKLASRYSVDVDIFSAKEKRGIIFGRHRLKSLYIERLKWLAIIYDVICVMLIKRGAYDLIHCNVEHFAPVAMILSYFLQVPYTITAHGTYGVLLPKRFSVFKAAFKKAARLICVSSYTAGRINEAGIKAKFHVIHNGVNTGVFKRDKNVEKENMIAFVGNLKKRKGFMFLLDALKKSRQSGLKFQLVFIGDIGISGESEINKIKSVFPDILFTGAITVEELVHFYQRAKLNILPSGTDGDYFEGFGLVHMEAIACGTLTVGTYESGNVEVIKPGNGFLVHYGDEMKLVSIIEKIISTSDSSKLMPKDENIRNWGNVTKEYYELFESLIKQ